MPELIHIYLSPDHNYFGHFGRPPGAHPLLTPDVVECMAGRGLRGDRFFDHQENYKGQVTFFAQEVYEELRQILGVHDRDTSVFRRNLITRGIDLNELIGQRFWLGGILFEGVEECRPCAWMDGAFGPGAEQALRGRGGLRARILSSGILQRGPVECEVLHAALV